MKRIDEISADLLSTHPIRQAGTWLGYHNKTWKWLAEQLGVSPTYLVRVRNRHWDEDAGRKGRPLSEKVASRLEELTGIRRPGEVQDGGEVSP